MKKIILLLFLFTFIKVKGNVINSYIDKNISHPNSLLKALEFNNDNNFYLISHGRSGELFINGKWLNSKQIVSFLKTKKLDGINNIFIFGCEFGKENKGITAVKYIEKSLGVSVSASTNITGKNGDWFFEIGKNPNKNITSKLKKYPHNLQNDGSVANPFESLSEISCSNFTAGVYNFNINGNTFSTFVDSNGYALVAIDFGNGSGGLPQGTALNLANRGILNPVSLASLTDIAEVRISSSSGMVDVTNTNSTLISRVQNNITLHRGAADNSINSAWVGTNASYFNGTARCNTPFGGNLSNNVYHPCGDARTFHWMPLGGFQRELWTNGEIPNNQSLRLWVKATDNIPPTITCPATVSVNVDAGTCVATGVALGTPTTADNCSVASLTNDAPSTFPLGNTTVTWTVEDGSGLTTTCEQTVTVIDNEPPVISCPADISQNVDAGTCEATVTYTAPEGTDNCTGQTTLQTAGLASGAVFPVGTTINTFEVTDAAGLKSSCSFTVTVIDNEPPVISCPADISQNVDAGTCVATGVTLGTPTTADNCSVASLTNDAPSTFPLGNTTVTWTVEDGSGLTTTCEQTVTVIDNIPPTITCPATVSVNVDAGTCVATGVALGTPTTADNCSVASLTNDAPSTFPLGDTTVTWTVEDGSGLTTTCEQTVTVIDNIPPTITCPATVSVNVDAGTCVATGVALGTPTTADNCSVASLTNDAPSTFPLGDTTVTWTVEDGSGLTTTCEQTVTVIDNIPPTITCPATVSVNVDAGTCVATGVTLGTPTTADNCSVASLTNDAPSTFPLGDTTVTWTVEDGSGLTTTCEQTVTVIDNIPPTITCPATVSVNVDAGTCVATGVALGTPTTADNCSVASLTNDAPSTFPLGNTTVTWTVEDGSGLTTTCEQTVTVIDNIPPTITCPATVSVNVDAGTCVATGVTLGTPTTADNCSVASLTNDAPSTFPLGDTTVTWTVEDGSGLTTTCEQTVTVIDNIPPTITCPATVSVNVDAGTCVATGVALGTPTTADNCSVASLTNDAPSTFPLGNTTVTWTVEDGSGLTTTCEQTVTVIDNIPPTITCPATVSVNVDAGTCVATGVALGTPTTADNCSVASLTNDAPSTFPLGDTTVTWTVEDGSGLTTTCEQTVTVIDNIPPTITCPATVSVNVDAGTCVATGVTLGTPTTADNCSVASLTNDAPSTFPLGNTTVTWTVEDGSGLTTTCEQTVTVIDNIPPTITCPATVSVNVDAGTCVATGVALGTPTTADNCSVASLTNDAPSTFPLGDTTVTWTVEDGSGLTTTCEQTVTVIDNIPPTITCPATVSVNVDAGTCVATGVTLGTPTTADNCSVASLTNDAPSTFPLGNTTVTWTVEDGSGLTTTCEQTVTVIDNIPPTITCPATVSVNVDAGTCVATGVALGTPTTADNCSVASLTNDAPSTFPLGDTTVTWTVEDGSGLTTTCEQTVTVIDNIPPTITCPATVSVNVDAGTCVATGVALGTPTTADNCSVASLTNDAPSTFPLGDTTVTWTVEDGSGLTTTCEQTVTVIDNIPPTITCPATVSVNVDAGTCVATGVTLGTPTTADNCSVASLTNDAPSTFPLGDTTVTWTVEDGSGLTTTCEQTVTVIDNIPPTITCPATVSVNVDAGTCVATGVALGTPTTADNCSVASLTNDAPSTFPLGDTTVTWTVEDGSGLTTTCEQTVTVIDNIPPTITCPATVSVNVDAGTCVATGVALGTPTTADNCSVASLTNDAPSTFPLGNTTVTWTVEDGSGLTTTCEQTVTVIDNIPPTITCPATVSVNVDAGTCVATGVALGTPTTADNCSVASLTNDAPSTFPLGNTTVTWTVEDGSGLTTTCEQTVTVIDNIPPTITCPATVSVNVDAGTCVATGVTLGTPTTADNCSVASLTNDAPSTFPLGDTTVTWTVEDGSGLTTTCEQTVTVIDNIPPTITCPATVSVNVDAGTCVATGVALGTPTTADNCSVASLTNDAPSTFPLGNTTVTWTVEDGSGLTTTCEQTVTVIDNIPPTITCPATVSVNVDAGTCVATGVALGTPTTADNCSVASLTNDAPSTFPLGNTTVTWTVEDGSGLTTTCEQTVTVIDNIPPTITCPATVSVNVDAGTCVATGVALGTPTTADNCSVASLTNDAPSTFPLGDTTVTWTVEDGSGLTTTCEQTVTVIDNIPPTITCPATVSVNVDAGTCVATGVALGTPTTADNCSVASLTNDAPSTFPLGNTTVTWTVEDGSGLTTTCEQTVTVIDNIPPTITCPATVSVNVDAGTCVATGVALGTPTTADNCSVASLTNDAPSTFPLGDTTVTWTVEDGSGLTTTCEQTVTVIDNIPPTITCPATVSVNVDAGTCVATGVTLGTPTTADNCSVASLTNDAPSTFPLGNTTVTWTVEDGSGLTTTCEQTVTVIDNIPPTITCPATVSVNVDAGTCVATGVALGTPTTADNCSVASLTNDAPSTFPLGDTTVTWTVEDGSGLTTTCEQTVTVIDNIPPTITCPATVSVNVDAGTCVATGVTLGTPTTADNCSVASLTNDAPSTFPLGNTTVTWTVEDGSGLTTTCEQTVTVIDNIPPTITCPATVSVNVDAGTCVATGVALGTPTTADNCSVASLTNDAPSTFPLGNTTVTWTVEDGSGLTTTCEQTVTVIDNIPPTITCPADISQNVDAGVCGATVTYTTPEGTDNCTGQTTVQTAGLASGAVFPVGTTTNTFEVTDAAGLKSSCSFTVEITVDPLNPGSFTGSTINGCVGYNPPAYNATSASGGATPYSYQWELDEVAIAGATSEDYNHPAFTASGTFVLRRKVTDACGTVAYSNEKTFNINEDPSISLVSSTTICSGETHTITATTDGGNGTCTFVWQSSSDEMTWTTEATNTSTTFTTQSLTSDTYFRVQRNCTGSGCNDPFSNSILVTIDSTPPVAPTIADQTFECRATPTAPITTDSCDSGIITGTTTTSFPITDLGTTVVTWTFTDAQGNSTTANQNIIVTSCEADLSLTKKVDKAIVKLNDTVVFTLRVTNSGPESAFGVQVKDVLPSGLTYDASNSVISTGSYNSTTGIWDLSGVEITNGQTIEIKIAAQVTSAGIISNVSEVIQNNQKDPDSTPNNGN